MATTIFISQKHIWNDQTRQQTYLSDLSSELGWNVHTDSDGNVHTIVGCDCTNRQTSTLSDWHTDMGLWHDWQVGTDVKLGTATCDTEHSFLCDASDELI